jgi:hypothetical protein
METKTAEQLLAALTVEKANINTYKTVLGFSGAQISESEQDHANLSAAIANVGIADADKQSVTKVKNAIYNGDINESIQPYPSFTLTTLPFPDVKAGALSRYNNRKGHAKLSANYTDQIGTAMGYKTVTSDPVSPDAVIPLIEAINASAFGYAFGMIVSGREKADMWEVQIQREGSNTWQTVASATGKSADITITPTTPGKAERILVRVILKKNNQYYGQPSDPKFVTVNP